MEELTKVTTLTVAPSRRAIQTDQKGLTTLTQTMSGSTTKRSSMNPLQLQRPETKMKILSLMKTQSSIIPGNTLTYLPQFTTVLKTMLRWAWMRESRATKLPDSSVKL